MLITNKNGPQNLSIEEMSVLLCRVFKSYEHANQCSKNDPRSAVIIAGQLVLIHGKNILTDEVIQSHKNYRGGESLSEAASRLVHFLLWTKSPILVHKNKL